MGQSVGQTPNLVLVRVWDEGAWAIFDRSPLGSAVPWRVSVDGGAPSPAGESLVNCKYSRYSVFEHFRQFFATCTVQERLFFELEL